MPPLAPRLAAPDRLLVDIDVDSAVDHPWHTQYRASPGKRWVGRIQEGTLPISAQTFHSRAQRNIR